MQLYVTVTMLFYVGGVAFAACRLLKPAANEPAGTAAALMMSSVLYMALAAWAISLLLEYPSDF